MQTEPSAKIIRDSISPTGVRLTTFEVIIHRMMLSEWNTHRVFSRNSASSRAIPFRKQRKRVLSDIAWPVVWASEQKGMQGGDELTGWRRRAARGLWKGASLSAVGFATALGKIGLHKSLVNRLLEPFMWHTIIVTSVDYENFFHQRVSPLAQPEIRLAAEAMLKAYQESTPTLLQYGEWHTPLIQPDEESLPLEDRKRISAARCARVSYLTHAGIRDIAEDIAMYLRLTTADPAHASPLEHVATPHSPVSSRPEFGNFPGWDQLRHLVLGF